MGGWSPFSLSLSLSLSLSVPRSLTLARSLARGAARLWSRIRITAQGGLPPLTLAELAPHCPSLPPFSFSLLLPPCRPPFSVSIRMAASRSVVGVTASRTGPRCPSRQAEAAARTPASPCLFHHTGYSRVARVVLGAVCQLPSPKLVTAWWICECLSSGKRLAWSRLACHRCRV